MGKGGGLTGHAPQGRRRVKRVPRDSPARDRHVAAGRLERSGCGSSEERRGERSGAERTGSPGRLVGAQRTDRGPQRSTVVFVAG